MNYIDSQYLPVPTIASQLPIQVGKGRIAALRFSCPQCLTEIKEEHLLGDIIQTKKQAEVRGTASCHVCGHIAHIEVDLDRTGRLKVVMDGEVLHQDCGVGLTAVLRMIPKYGQLLWRRLVDPNQKFSFRIRPVEPEVELLRREIRDVSDELVGQYRDTPIPKWIDLENGDRYVFDRITPSFRESVLACPSNELLIWPGLIFRLHESSLNPW